MTIKVGAMPAVVAYGRWDALPLVSDTSRPRRALCKVTDGAASELSCVEVTTAQHLDGLAGLCTLLPGYESRYIPQHVCLSWAFDTATPAAGVHSPMTGSTLRVPA